MPVLFADYIIAIYIADIFSVDTGLSLLGACMLEPDLVLLLFKSLKCK